MSVANIINPVTQQIYPEYIPGGGQAPGLSQVLAVDSRANGQTITDVGALTAFDVAAYSLTAGNAVIDGGSGFPIFLRNTVENTLSLIAEGTADNATVQTGNVQLKGNNGASTCTLSTSGNQLLVNGQPVSGGGGTVGTLGQVLLQGNDAGGIDMTNVGDITANDVYVGAWRVYQKDFYPGVGIGGEDPEQRLYNETLYTVTSGGGQVLTDVQALPGQVYNITATSPNVQFPVYQLPNLPSTSTIGDRTTIYFLIHHESEPINFILKQSPQSSILCQPGESVRLTFVESTNSWRYIGM